mgnify:CR=1 FL=1
MCCPAKALSYLELSVRCAPRSRGRGGGVQDFREARRDRAAVRAEPPDACLLHRRPSAPESRRDLLQAATRQLAGKGITSLVDTANLDGRAYYTAWATPSRRSANNCTSRKTSPLVSDKLITFVMTYDDPEDVHPSGQGGRLPLSAGRERELTPSSRATKAAIQCRTSSVSGGT